MGSFLYVSQEIRIQNGRINLANCHYRFSTSPDLRDEAAWVVRYEYSLDPLPNQPHAHLHVNGVHKHTGAPMDRLHLPSGRISVEQFLAHLLIEHGIEPLPEFSREDALMALRHGHEEFSRHRTDFALFP